MSASSGAGHTPRRRLNQERPPVRSHRAAGTPELWRGWRPASITARAGKRNNGHSNGMAGLMSCAGIRPKISKATTPLFNRYTLRSRRRRGRNIHGEGPVPKDGSDNRPLADWFEEELPTVVQGGGGEKGVDHRKCPLSGQGPPSMAAPERILREYHEAASMIRRLGRFPPVDRPAHRPREWAGPAL